MLWKRFLPPIPGSFPRELRSETCGLLELNLGYLVLKDQGLVYVSEDGLMPGNEIVRMFVRYEPQPDNGIGLAVTLHPPERGRVDSDRWIAVFDSIFSYVSQGWRQILADEPKKITEMLRRYGEKFMTGEELVPALILKNMSIGVDSSSANRVFEPAWPFDSLNLNVSVSHGGKVIDAHFEG